jgi:hypothetical protein
MRLFADKRRGVFCCCFNNGTPFPSLAGAFYRFLAVKLLDQFLD